MDQKDIGKSERPYDRDINKSAATRHLKIQFIEY
jgi:hypothetical protein